MEKQLDERKRKFRCTDCDGCGEISIVDCDTGFCNRCDPKGEWLYKTEPEVEQSEKEALPDVQEKSIETQVRGEHEQEYALYCHFSSDNPLKSYDEWVNS